VPQRRFRVSGRFDDACFSGGVREEQPHIWGSVAVAVELVCRRRRCRVQQANVEAAPLCVGVSTTEDGVHWRGIGLRMIGACGCGRGRRTRRMGRVGDKRHSGRGGLC